MKFKHSLNALAAAFVGILGIGGCSQSMDDLPSGVTILESTLSDPVQQGDEAVRTGFTKVAVRQDPVDNVDSNIAETLMKGITGDARMTLRSRDTTKSIILSYTDVTATAVLASSGGSLQFVLLPDGTVKYGSNTYRTPQELGTEIAKHPAIMAIPSSQLVAARSMFRTAAQKPAVTSRGGGSKPKVGGAAYYWDGTFWVVLGGRF